MGINSQEKAALEEIINTIIEAKSPRKKRDLADMFLELVDKSDWPQYYEVIPQPRCLNDIQEKVEQDHYENVTQVYTDLSLVFWNALFYNEPDSQIAEDASTLKTVLETEWKKHSFLPPPRTSPPPEAPQAVHSAEETQDNEEEQEEEQTVEETQEPVAISAPVRASSPDMDVDIMSPDSDGLDDGPTNHDPLSNEITSQLERGLPRWQGFGEKGWMESVTPDRMVDIVHAIKSHKDIVGNRLATALEETPEEPVIPNLSYSGPISLKTIDAKARARGYASAKEFDLDMARMFEKARRWHEIATEPYGRVLLLQRLYQGLTSSNPPLGPPYISSTSFAALRAGPGTVKPVHGADSEGVPSVTTHRVVTKDRVFLDEINYKGWTVKLADWLHLANPDDPSRPIIGQIFRCWVSEEPSRKGQLGVTVSWYYRPEQTFHPPSRQFWEREVFKTSHFADHPVEDIIEKIACQFTARHVRGRPRPPFWYVGWPLYVCDSRYNDRERIFVKIKNWNSCVPEEVRKSVEFMPIYPFERMVYPARQSSPFLATKPGTGAALTTKFPGGLLPEPDGAETDAKRAVQQQRREVVGTPHGHYAGPTVQSTQSTYYPNAMYATPQSQAQLPLLRPQTTSMQRTPAVDRSIVGAAGGLGAIGGTQQVEKLPAETAKLFDRDPSTNQVLWFASPPVDIARPKPAQHSLEYLHFLARKRKREMEISESGEGAAAAAVDREETTPTRLRVSAPTVMERLAAVAKEIRG